MKIATTLCVLLCFFMSSRAQEKSPWFLEAAVRFTGDAEMAFIGPSFSLGTGVSTGKKWSFTSSYTFFASRYRSEEYVEKFSTHTIDLLANRNFLNVFNPAKGWYLGAGIAWQARKASPDELDIEKGNYFTAAFNAGYYFPITIRKKLRTLSIDWKAFGPYTEPGEHYTEVFTQFMIGLKLRY